MSTPSTTAKLISRWQHHLQDEVDAVYLYQGLLALESDPKKQSIFRRLAEVEQRHVEVWFDTLTQHGIETTRPTPTLKARLVVRAARSFGTGLVLPMIMREEGQEVRGYLSLYKESPPGEARDAALLLAKESAGHAEDLGILTETTGEPWHNADSGSLMRNIIYGFNDGLTANFGLVAGMIGASASPEILLVSGLAGTIADALSMGASGYLAAKSEQELYENEVEMERDEIALMPELEQEELALLYEARGLSRELSEAVAADLMKDPEKALAEKVRTELGIQDSNTTPMREAWLTGSATAVGAIIPVIPFLVSSGTTAIVGSFTLAMVSHFAVGAGRSFFTGRSLFRSGIDMFAVGLGVAAVGYVLGELLSRLLH